MVDAGAATLHELRTTWSLDDVARYMACQAAKSDIEAMVTRAIDREQQHGR